MNKIKQWLANPAAAIAEAKKAATAGAAFVAAIVATGILTGTALSVAVAVLGLAATYGVYQAKNVVR